LVIDTVVYLTLAKWETVSGRFGGYLIDLGSGLKAKTNVAIWRTRGEYRPLIGEFAFQIYFRDRKSLTLDSMKRAERFFLALQYAARDHITLNATKTGVAYRLLGNAPTAHE
jgi:hypothetical protein